MAEYERDDEYFLDKTDVIEIDEEQKRATVNVEATWQEYEDAVEFRFTAGEARIEITVPYAEAAYAQILVASLPQAFETALEAYFDDVIDEDSEVDEDDEDDEDDEEVNLDDVPGGN